MPHIHFIAIAGTGMGSLAGLLKSRGYHVTGSDEGVYPPMSTALEAWGIRVATGFRAENVLEPRPDLVVIGNAVRPDNPEAGAALEAGLPVLSFPDTLYEHGIRGKHSVVVSGTHGKTTTASMVATLLFEAGRDPSMLVGGLTVNFDGSFRDGAGPEFVVEGDEYDTVFFDKTPKFLHYHAETLVITSLEFDHADIYRDLSHIEGEFRKLVKAMPASGKIIASSDESVGRILGDAPCSVVRYGVEGDAPLDLRACDLCPGAEGTRFTLEAGGAKLPAFLPAHGRYNVANALAALGVLQARGVGPERAVDLLACYRGVRRRQEVRGKVAGVTVIDDFAHHPTAVRETLGGLRAAHPDARLIAVFEPRSNTSRRALFQQDYARSFDGADRVVVSVVPDAPIYSATGEVTERLSAEQLARDLEARGVSAVALHGVDAIVEHLAADARPGDLVVTLSNGGFDGIWDKLLTRLEGTRSEGHSAR
jgi:UDP-N-acetylmuramate: L-alanyl-gamma-D-glutamyl-meso-diaminopimelate ligase